MVQELISSLFDKWAGKPILVIGGGPSALTDLLNWPENVNPVAVLSANQHGCRQTRFPVDLLVNVDKIHTERRVAMSTILRPYGIPIVNRHSWADYRLADWDFSANSGITAVAVAVALGGNPVIVTGIDMWESGRQYFHDEDVIALASGTRPPRVHRRETNKHVQMRSAQKRLNVLASFARGANIRPMSGPMTNVFERFDPQATIPTATACAYRKAHTNEYTVRFRAQSDLNFEQRDVVKVGTVLALSRTEARVRKLGNLHYVV